MKVKITECSQEDAWYKNRIGEEYEVRDVSSISGKYMLTGEPHGMEGTGIYCILKSDCEIISEILPDTTEGAREMIRNPDLFNMLAQYGGYIVNTSSLDSEQINQAKASGRMFVDENSLGYVWEPPAKFPETAEEVELFERWYPLPVEMPEDLKDLPSRIIRGEKFEPPKYYSESALMFAHQRGVMFASGKFHISKQSRIDDFNNFLSHFKSDLKTSE